MNKLINQNILVELGLNNLSQQEADEIMEVFHQTVFQAVILRIADQLNADGRAELEAVLAASNDEILGVFLKKRVENLDILVTEECLKFKQMMIGKARETDKKIQYQKIAAMVKTPTAA